MTYTAPLKDEQPLSLETLTAAMKEVGLVPHSNQWVVIDPNGMAYATDFRFSEDQYPIHIPAWLPK